MAFIPPMLAAAGSFIVSNLPTIMSVATLASAGVSAYGAIKAGEAEQYASNAEAFQLDQRAKQERAVSQLEAARRRRAGKAMLSTQKSLLADTGFASDDPTSLNLVSETVKSQTLEELLTLAQGEDLAKQDEFQAQQVRTAGKNAMKGARITALSQLIGSGASWYDRFGAGRRAVVRPGGGKSGFNANALLHSPVHAG